MLNYNLSLILMFNFEELDEKTRKYMLEEFEKEISGNNPYRSKEFSDEGWRQFPEIMKRAILYGNEETLIKDLQNPTYWKDYGERFMKKTGKVIRYKIDPVVAAERFAQTEFNTWYVRGLARRLLEEGVENCQVYRAAPAINPRIECCGYEGQVFSVKDIYNGHRKRYWPEPGDPDALSIPVGPNCHHTIRRCS